MLSSKVRKLKEELSNKDQTELGKLKQQQSKEIKGVLEDIFGTPSLREKTEIEDKPIFEMVLDRLENKKAVLTYLEEKKELTESEEKVLDDVKISIAIDEISSSVIDEPVTVPSNQPKDMFAGMKWKGIYNDIPSPHAFNENEVIRAAGKILVKTNDTWDVMLEQASRTEVIRMTSSGGLGERDVRLVCKEEILKGIGPTGVTSGTYGAPNKIPVFTVGTDGRLYQSSEVLIAVSGAGGGTVQYVDLTSSTLSVSGNVVVSGSLNVELPSIGQLSGYKFVSDQYGRIISGSNLIESDIPQLSASKIGSGNVLDSEFGRLFGVSANIQSQLNGKGTVNSVGVSSTSLIASGVVTTSGDLSVELPEIITSGKSLNISYDKFGRIVSATPVTSADIPNLPYLPISGGEVLGNVKLSALSAEYVDIDTTKATTYKSGRIGWNLNDRTYDMCLDDGVVLQAGQELVIFGHNESGSTILNGKAVYVTSAGTAGGMMHLAIASKDSVNAHNTIAIATQDILNNTTGYVTKVGKVRGINTSSLVEGNKIYLGYNGALTSTPAVYPDRNIVLGYCLVSHPTEGVIYVDITNEFAVEELYNVKITNPSAGDSFIYENNRWINRNFGNITKETTGFKNPENVIVTYDEVTRRISLSGEVEAYWRSNVVPEISAGYISPPAALTSGTQFLLYDGVSIKWQTTPWTYDQLQIALVSYDVNNNFVFGLRECHGTMQWQVHKEFHNTVGTFLESGADVSSYILNSTVPAERRVDISTTIISDEDLQTTISPINNEQYTTFSLSGTGVSVFASSATDIIPLNVNQPFYNQFNAGVWTQTPFPNNSYGAIFVIAIPTTSDTKSQDKRFVFVQPQIVNSTLSVIQNISPIDVNLDGLTRLTPEFVFVAKIIVRYSSNNWTITQVDKIAGTRANQSYLTGGFLTVVSTSPTLSGNGTVGSPIGLADGYTPGIYTKVSVDAFGRSISGSNLLSGDIPVISYSRIDFGPTTSGNINYLSSVSADIQSQINSKGTVSSVGITSNTLSASNVVSGTGNLNVELNQIITSGTATKVTYDQYGRVVSAGSLTSADIPTIKAGLEFASYYDASTNTPPLGIANESNKNTYYVVSASGVSYGLATRDLSGNIILDVNSDPVYSNVFYSVGDLIISNGIEWIPVNNFKNNYQEVFTFSNDVIVEGILETTKVVKRKVSTISVSATLDFSYDRVLCNSSTPITITLPDPSTSSGFEYTIKNINTGNVTVNTVSGTIDGESNVNISNQYDSLTFVCNGSSWFIV